LYYYNELIPLLNGILFTNPSNLLSSDAEAITGPYSRPPVKIIITKNNFVG
jgi:hypothetical protein